MRIKGQIRINFVMMVMTIFLFENCATIIRRPSQKIPVTSNPIGAKVIVDGEEMGDTPLNLKLKRKKEHLIRIEKRGYNPLELRITRKPSALLSVLGNIFWGLVFAIPGAWYTSQAIVIGPLSGQEEEITKGSTLFILGFFVGWGCGILMDVLTGVNYTLSPEDLIVTLRKIEDKSHPHFILIDAERFQHVKWIRIKLGDSEEE